MLEFSVVLPAPPLYHPHHLRTISRYLLTTAKMEKTTHFWATVCKTVRLMLSDHCLSCLGTLVYCGQTVGWIKMKLGMRVGLCPGHIVLDGDPAPLPNLQPISIVDKRLDGSRRHLVPEPRPLCLSLIHI